MPKKGSNLSVCHQNQICLCGLSSALGCCPSPPAVGAAGLTLTPETSLIRKVAWICAREDLSVPSLTAPCPPQYVFLPHTFWRERPKRGLDRMTGLSLGCTLLGSHVHHRLAFVPLRPVHARAADPHLQRAAWKGRREARGELGGERTHLGCHQVRAVKRHGRLICSSRLRPLEALWRQTG